MMERYSKDFPTQLDGFDLNTLEADPNSIYALARDLTLNYVNPAWLKFARDNGGESAISEHFTIGTSIAEAFSGPLKTYYLGIYSDLLSTGEVWHHEYECSAENIYRLYHQTIYPLRNKAGLLVVNSLLVEQPHGIGLSQATKHLLKTYQEPNGLITGCSHCKRVRRVLTPDVWDWISQWNETVPANMSHSLCPLCYDYFYKHLHQNLPNRRKTQR
jgi:hypothetical protein